MISKDDVSAVLCAAAAAGCKTVRMQQAGDLEFTFELPIFSQSPVRAASPLVGEKGSPGMEETELSQLKSIIEIGQGFRCLPEELTAEFERRYVPMKRDNLGRLLRMMHIPGLRRKREGSGLRRMFYEGVRLRKT